MSNAITLRAEALAPVLARLTALAGDQATKRTVPILACVHLSWGKDALHLAATDMEVFLEETVAVTTGEPWSGCVDAAQLEAFVKSMPRSTELRLAGAGETLDIAGGDAVARLSVLPVDEFPKASQPEGETVEVELSAADLAAALRFTVPFSSEDKKSRYYLHGVFLDPAGITVATNGKCLARRRLAGLKLPEGIIVPRPASEALLDFLKSSEAPVTLAASDRIVTVSVDRWSLTSKLIDGTYPEWRRVIPKRVRRPIMVDRGELRVAIKRVADVAATDKTPEVRLRLADGALTVAGGSVTAKVHTVLTVANGPPTARVALNARYLLATLAVIDDDMVALHLGDESTPVWVCAAREAEDGVAIMSIRTSWEEF